jgi:DNA polymerase-3 subunit gamma/tau
LFGGFSGVGKTTMARVIGSSLNCINRDGVEPCGECSACKAIWRGEGAVWEIDASFFGLTDNIRELRDKLSSYSFASYQVVILDECHMMSKEAFNVLLKVLEEPPKNVMFVLVTTEPNKVLDTVRSRLLEFRFKAIPTSVVLIALSKLLEKEGVTCNPGLLERIYALSNTNFRDALTSLEQLAILGDKVITPELVKGSLGDVQLFDRLVEQMLLGNFDTTMVLFEEYYNFQSNVAIFIENLINFVVERISGLMRDGQDTTKYMMVLRSIYRFLNGRFVVKGKSAIRILLYDIVTSFSKSGPVTRGTVSALSNEDVLDILTKSV